MKVTYYLEVISSWCFWAEPTWELLKRQYAGRVEFGWKIALMPAEAYPVSKEQCEWFYRRSGSVMRSPFMLNSGWFQKELKQYFAPNYVAEAAKDFGVTDDRVRLAIAHAALREGRQVGQWEIAAAAAAAAGGLVATELLSRAKSPEVEERVRQTTNEFHALQVNQRPTFLLEDEIGDRAVFSGLVVPGPLVATIDAMLSDAAAYASHAVHFGGPPTK